MWILYYKAGKHPAKGYVPYYWCGVPKDGDLPRDHTYWSVDKSKAKPMTKTELELEAEASNWKAHVPKERWGTEPHAKVEDIK